MIIYFKLYILTFLAFLAVDGVWLGLVAKNFYAKHLGFLMSPTPNLPAAFLFYLLNIIGLIILVVVPALQENNLIKVLWLGALYGLCTYATYDLTNLATIKNWPLLVTIVDLFWGVIISTFTAFVGYKIGKLLGL